MRGEAHLRPVGLVPSFLEHLGRSSIVEGLVRSLVVVEAQVGPDPWLKGQTCVSALRWANTQVRPYLKTKSCWATRARH